MIESVYKSPAVGVEDLVRGHIHVAAVGLYACGKHYLFVSLGNAFCKINNKNGCRSLNFLSKDESLLTFNQIYKNIELGNLTDKVMSISKVPDRLDFLISFFREHTKVDITEYLYNTLALDMIIKNPDRHFNNLALILCADGSFNQKDVRITKLYLDLNVNSLNELFMLTMQSISDEGDNS